jgi:tetratricopeptide (TPR) repeat protein
LRERLIKNDGSYKWIAPIHETLIEQRPTRKADIEGIDVLHLSTNERKEKAIGRNIPALQLSIYQKEGKDPRPLYYLGKAYYDRFQIKRDVKYLNMAKNLFEQYLGGENKSGWAEERSQCWEYLIAVYQVAGQLDNAIKCAHNAMIESETSPSIYINLAMCYLLKKEYERALFWVKMGIKLPQPKTTLIITPRDLMARAFEVVFHASLNLSKLNEAWAAAQKLIEIYPTNQEMQNRVAITNQLRDQRELTKSLVELSKYLESHGEGYKIKPLVMSAPELIKDNPFVVDLANKVNPPRDWEDNEVCIYCGPGFSTWSPRQLEDGKTFVGGSEEAVMYLAQALTKQGWKVTVYADPGDDEGDWDGVLYLPYYKWNKRDQFNIVVSWRRPDFVDQGFKAKKTYIWCHDIQQQMDYTPERLEKITKIIVLSPWHRTNLPDIPDDKIIISTNGIQL